MPDERRDRYLALSQDEEILMGPDIEAASGL